jgi:hypothetical protein
MTIAVRAVPEGACLIDCYAPLSLAALLRLKNTVWNGRPIVGCFRYHDNLTLLEKTNILSVGWGLMTVGVARGDSMETPSAGLGSRDGLRAVANLRALEIPSGVTDSLDVEGTTKAGADDVVSYTNAWDGVVRVQTETCFYEGWGIPLSADALFQRMAPHLYWASSPSSLPPARRGFACVQLVENITLAGVQVDVDECKADLLGGTMHWLVDDLVAAA